MNSSEISPKIIRESSIGMREAGANFARSMRRLQRATQPRLQHRRPPFDADRVGDAAVIGVERALQLALERAVATGKRQVVTLSPYGRMPGADEPVLRVQAWR